jgi:hypothetical protein
MTLASKLIVGWDLFINWLRDAKPGSLFFRPATPIREESIAVEIHDNHIHVQAKTQSTRALSMILDSGADYNALNASLSDELGVKHKIEINLSGAGTGEEKTTLYFTKTIPLELMGVPLRANILGPLSKLEDGIGRRIDGILGAEIFNRCVVKINYPAQTISLHPPQTYTAPERGEIIPILLEGRRPFIQARIRFPGLDDIEGKFIIDTGDSSGLSLHAPFVQKHDLLSRAGEVIPHFTSGIAGEAREYLGRAESFQLGGFTIERPVVALSQADKGSTSDENYDGAVGGEILRRFKIILDYSRRQMILEPNADFEAPFDVDMSGMALVAEGRNFEAIQISRIYANTPASESGLGEGDTLLELNGAAAEKLGLEQIKRMFRVDGQEFQLVIKRDEQPLEFKLTTRRLV